MTILFRKIRSVATALIFTAAFCFSVFAAGELDPGFAAAVNGNTSGQVNVVKLQADGKILVGGYFSDVNGVSSNGIMRLNGDGTTDLSFNIQNLFESLGTGANISSIYVQSDGKILVGGYFYSSSGIAQPGLRRINSDGSLDPVFTTFTLFGGAIYDIEIQADGKIIIGGEFSGPNSTQNIARLNSNGIVDTTFSGTSSVTIKDLALQADGKLVVGGNFTGSSSTGWFRRLNTNGSDDGTFTSFTASGIVEAVKIKADGQIMIGGGFTNVNGFTQSKLAMLNTDGSLDLTFNQNNPGVSGFPQVSVYDIEFASNGKILIGGRFLSYNGTSRNNLAQLNADGTLDTAFQNNSILLNSSTLYDLEVLPDGSLIAGTSFSDLPVSVRKFGADGTLDSGFASVIAWSGRVREVFRLSDGKILIGGDFLYVNNTKRHGIARLNTDGTTDTGFVPYFNNQALLPTITAIGVQTDGKVLVGVLQQLLRRLNSDGTQDTTFNPPDFGTTHDVIVLTSGQVLVGGTYGIRRLNANGSLDSTFAASVNNVLKIILQSDGKILIGGEFTQVGGSIRGRIARLNADGSLDNSFNPPGGANGAVQDFDIQTDGKVVLGGDFTALNGVNRFRVGRLNADGSLDTGFSQSADGTVRAVKAQPDGKILIGGSFGFVQSELHIGLTRLNPSGTVDSSFVSSPNTSVYDIGLQSDNKIIVGGEFIRINGTSAVRIARLLNTAVAIKTMFDFDGDGRADISVFRPSTNRWYKFLSGSSTVSEQSFGNAGDIVAPADYDGDEKTDVAVFRPSTGDWWYFSSVSGTQVQNHWGAAGDIPLPGDFDGDGKADFVVFRPSENNWYRYGSTGITSIIKFGIAGDKPLLGDFDGDGKSDLAIYRPSTGDWWYRSSASGAQIAIKWGISTDIPAPADYDGDGKTDLAVFRPSTGVWYILKSSDQTFAIGAFGLSGDKPVPADYDGDGKSDIAVFRPSTGVWYLLNSTAGFSAAQFGVSTDTAVPNSFVP